MGDGLPKEGIPQTNCLSLPSNGVKCTGIGEQAPRKGNCGREPGCGDKSVNRLRTRRLFMKGDGI